MQFLKEKIHSELENSDLKTALRFYYFAFKFHTWVFCEYFATYLPPTFQSHK